MSCLLPAWSRSVTALPLARQQLATTHLPRWFRRATPIGVILMDDAAASLDAHWAVAVFEAAERRDMEFRGWLELQRARLFMSGIDDDWATTYLRSIVELWTEVLSGAGPSALERAMELVATIRENRPERERETLESADEMSEMTLR